MTRHTLSWIVRVIFVTTLCLFTSVSYAQNNKPAIVLDINGAIGPTTQAYVEHGLKQATQEHAAVVILRLDTPGGLDKSMRNIVRDIIASPIPVIAYVAPSGARAASAGTYILYASHIAAMAPGTNLGAATPVSIGLEENSKSKPTQPSTMETKTVNDAAAYIRGLAQLRNRNAEWAEKAVRQSVSLSANEAQKINVINLIAKNIPDLLTQLNNKTIDMQGEKQTLHTANLDTKVIELDWKSQLLSIITDPNVAYVLLIVGIWGLIFEFAHPGFIVPGVVGAIALLLALYAFQLLPISYAGLGLIFLGIAFLVAEAFLPTFGVIGIGGIIAFAIGSLMLLNPETPGYAIALPLILSLSAVTAAFFLLIINIAIRARFRPIVSGREELIGHTITILAVDDQNQAWTRVHGELWQAQSIEKLKPGQKATIVKMEGVILFVEPNQ